MPIFDDVAKITGHPVGGVCPFGLNNNINIYMDECIRNFEYVYPAAGSKNLAMKIAPIKIQELTNASWVDICTL